MSIISNSISIQDSILIGGNITTDGNIIAGGSVAGNIISIEDGLNVGTISQVSTELTLSSSGGIVAIPNGCKLLFTNDSSLAQQSTAYDGRGLVDDCELLTSIYNASLPAFNIYALSSTVPMNQIVPSSITIGGANLLRAFAIRLVKGQLVNGAAFCFTGVSGTPSGVMYALYNTASPAVRLAVTNTFVPTARIFPVNFTSAYTVPTTGLYYVAVNAANIGSALNLATLAADTYVAYSINQPITGVLNNIGHRATVVGMPQTLAGVSLTLDTQRVYAAVYSLTN